MGSRADIYTKVHKGLRKALFDLSYCAGRTDGTNDEELISLAKLFNDVIKFLEEHGRNEELYQLPLLEARCPGAAKHDNEDHKMIEKQIEALKRNFNNLVSSSAKERRVKTEVFYHLFNDFISIYLKHMLNEELETTKLFHEYCTDDEINSALKKIISNTAPQDMMMMLKFMIPAINRSERLELVSGIKQNAPQPAFNAILVLTQSVINAEEYNYIIENLPSTGDSEKKVWEAVA